MCYNFLLKQSFTVQSPPFLEDLITEKQIGSQNKFGLTRLDLIIYIRAARTAVDHVGAFKICFVGTLLRNLRLDF